jgi:hypothetical protein
VELLERGSAPRRPTRSGGRGWGAVRGAGPPQKGVRRNVVRRRGKAFPLLLPC